jgi:pimeloyl-ACP methyl ester carboxylesterase
VITSQIPIVVLVHGAWHGAWCWASLQAELDSRGIASLAIDLPGHGTSLEPFGDLYGDATHVSKVLTNIHQPVVLVGHSYGGAVISQAVAATHNVVHLVYLTAFVPDVGEGVLSLLQSMPDAPTVLSSAMVIGNDGFSTINPDLAVAAFYAHCTPASTPANVARLCAQPFATFTQPLTSAAWKTIRSTFVRCTDDNAIHISHQDQMAQRCSLVETLVSDHSPFASVPAQTADILERIAHA